MFIKLKDNQIFSGFSQTQQYIILFYLDDDMFRSLDHNQAIFTKIRITCSKNNIHVIWDMLRLINVLKYT